MEGFLKFIGSVIVWVSLSVGAVSAATSYIVPVANAHSDSEWFRASGEAASSESPAIGPNGYLKTLAVAGPKIAKDGAMTPMFPVGTELTPEVVDQMIGDDPKSPVVSRVKVAEWSFGRWSSKYWFFGAAGGLVVGGLMVRFAGRGTLPDESSADLEQTPTGAIEAARAVVQDVVERSQQAEDLAESLQLVNDELGELQQTHLATFANAREGLIARYGLGSFAGIMDRFAEGERAVNRAWSAAADGRIGPPDEAPDMLAEVIASLAIADASFEEARALL